MSRCLILDKFSTIKSPLPTSTHNNLNRHVLPLQMTLLKTGQSADLWQSSLNIMDRNVSAALQFDPVPRYGSEPSYAVGNMSSVHENILDVTVVENLSEETLKFHPLKCDYCFQTLSGLTEYMSHKESQHPELYYLCSFCHKSYKSRFGFRSHVICVHVGSAKHQCEVCSQKFLQKGHLLRHKAVSKQCYSQQEQGEVN